MDEKFSTGIDLLIDERARSTEVSVFIVFSLWKRFNLMPFQNVVFARMSQNVWKV